MRARILLSLCICLLSIPLIAQDTLALTLDDVVKLARGQSVDALIATNRHSNANWNYQLFRADRRPVLALNGTLPSFDRTIDAITQPDGTDLFVSRSLATSSLNLSLSQEIGFTGGSIFAGSGLQRIDLFGDSTITNYLSNPLFIGLQQPILRFNPWKWRRQLEPLRMMQADQTLLEDREEIAVQAVRLFFQMHLAQINLDIATTNKVNNDTLYRISQGRYQLGKIAESDLLQVELNLLNAQVAMTRSENEVANAQAQLLRFLGLDENLSLDLIIPHDVVGLNIDPQKALEYAQSNRSDPINFTVQRLEAEQEVARAKGNSGFSADLFVQYGLNNTSNGIGEAYRQPENFQNVSLGLNIPILDWGKARATREIASANLDLVESQLALQEINFEQEIMLFVQQFNLQDNQVAIAAKADTVARRRFEVAMARYLIGKTAVTDLNIASNEEDQARRAYILALQNYWLDFYNLRRLTLHDWVRNEPIR